MRTSSHKSRMQVNKLSGLLNNCGLHGIVPELCNVIGRLAGEPALLKANPSLSHNYKKLLDCIHDYYGFASLDYKKLNDFLNCFPNAFDRQMFFGPVLRQFMQQQCDLGAVAEALRPHYKNHFRLIPGNEAGSGRYPPTEPDLLSVCLYKPLGINLVCYSPRGRDYRCGHHEINQTTYLSHQASTEHWERTCKGGDANCELIDDKKDRKMFAIAVDLGEGTFEASTKALQALKESFREGEILNEVKKIVQDEALKTAGVSVIRLIFSKPFIFICRLMPTTAWVKHTLRRLDQYSKKMPRGIARINTILNDGSVTAKQFSSIKQVVTEHTCCSAFFRDATTKEAYTKMDRIINRTPPAA